ncbi:hypothetical protein Tco_0988992 [Tanacetum coccineum]|uniref:Uncharacterized protein n=1 Tax=Tanacetum coccineum TaxID=301880 RepID=A0ABQ5ESF6_9ASTR
MVMIMMVVVLGLPWGSGGGYRRVEARGGGDRIDPMVRSNFGLGRKTHAIQPTHEAEETASMPHDSPLHVVHSHGSAEGSVQQHDLMVLVTKLNDRIDRLEKDLMQKKKTYSTTLTKLVLRVKKLDSKLKSGKARRKAKIVLSDDEEIAEDSSNRGERFLKLMKIQRDETEVLVQEETLTEIIEEHGSGEKGEMEISTTNIQVSIASPPKLSMDEELARKLEEEERIRFNVEQEARALQEEEEKRLNLEAARELQRQLDQRQDVPIQPTQTQGIDWNDPRSEVGKDSSKPSERETSKTVEEEKVEEEDKNPEPVLIEKNAVGIRRKTLARRRASDKQGQDSSKRQKKEKETTNYKEETLSICLNSSSR